MISRRQFNRFFLGGAALALTGCREAETPSAPGTQSPDDSDLLIWWEHGYLPEENEGIIRLVQSWEKSSGKRVLLKLVPDEFIGTELPKIERDSRVAPDLVFSIGFTTQHAPHLAWNGELHDLTDLIEPVRGRYIPDALSQVDYRNGHTGQRALYALPIGQSDDFVHFWRNSLEDIGLKPLDVPLEWERFWPFWCSVQDEYRRRGRRDVYGLGLCLSTIGFDFYTTLNLFLDARGVRMANEDGFIPLHEDRERERLADVLADIASFYRRGYVPPAAVTWSGSGNNVSFLEGEVLLTHNLTLSVPVTQKQAANRFNWDALERYRRIETLDRPLSVQGRPLPSRKTIKQIIAPVRGRNPGNAKDFLGFLLAENKFKELVRGFKGRIFPVITEDLSDPYWNDPADPHFAAALKIQQLPSRLPYEVVHPVFSVLQGRQVWAQALLKIATQGFTPQRAVAWLLPEAAAAQAKFRLAP